VRCQGWATLSLNRVNWEDRINRPGVGEWELPFRFVNVALSP